MTGELKPCPLCAESAALMYKPDWGNPWFVQCETCFCTTAQFVDKGSALRSWNTRASPPPTTTRSMGDVARDAFASAQTLADLPATVTPCRRCGRTDLHTCVVDDRETPSGQAMEEIVDAVAQAIDNADTGYSITLTGLVDGISTYTAKCGNEVRQFEWNDDAAEWCQSVRLKTMARAALTTAIPLIQAQERARIAAWLREGFPGAVPMIFLELLADQIEQGKHRG